MGWGITNTLRYPAIYLHPGWSEWCSGTFHITGSCGDLDEEQAEVRQSSFGWGPSESNSLSSLVLDGAALLQTDLVHHLRFLLDSWLLLEEQVAAIAERAFASCYIASWTGRPYQSLMPIVISQLDYCNAFYMGLPLKVIRKHQMVQRAAMWTILGAQRRTHPLFHKLHWVPIYFWV